jgi:hypothetical protein
MMQNNPSQFEVDSKRHAGSDLLPVWPSARARQITLTSLVVLWASSCAAAFAGGAMNSDFIAELGLGISSLAFLFLILIVVCEVLWTIWRWIRRLFS